MRFYAILAAIFSAIFCACSATSELSGEDTSLPNIAKIKTISGVNAVGFEWEKPQDSRIEGVAIYRESQDVGEFSEIAHIKDADSTHFVDSPLMPETEYRYFFRALGGSHYSAKSEIISAVTAYLPAVESIYASTDYADKIKLIFTTHENPSISYYRIEREERGEFREIGTAPHRLLGEYFDENLDAGKSYNYRVIAVNYDGVPSRPSKIVTGKTKPNSAPKITRGYVDNSQAQIAWEGVRGAKYYIISRTDLKSGASTRFTTSSTHFSDLESRSGGEFSYAVSAVDEKGKESEPSNKITLSIE